jgi:hypothetical protein
MCPRYTFRTKNEKLMKDFHECISKDNDSLYGVVEKEHDMAIKIYLAVRQYKDYPTKISFLSGPGGLSVEEASAHKKLTKKQRDLLNGFEKYLNPLDRFSDEVLVEAIETCMKIKDSRSVKGWIKYLIRIKFIRKDSLLYWTNIAPVDIYDIYPELAPVEVKHD